MDVPTRDPRRQPPAQREQANPLAGQQSRGQGPTVLIRAHNARAYGLTARRRILHCMRALLIVNPTATATTARSRDVVASALASEVKLDVAATNHRGHAEELATQARRDGIDLVLALGGDGTVNECVNGLLVDGPGEDVPAFAVIPGGSANVYARNLGFTNAAIEATGEVLESLHAAQFRTIGLGTAGDRYFAFAAGIGFDAAVVARVDRKRKRGTRATGGLYARSALAEFFFEEDHRHPSLTLTLPGAEPIEGLFFALITNASPFSYLGKRPVVVSPRATFETGIALYGLTTFRPFTMSRYTLASVLRANGPQGKHAVSLHDVGELTLSASRPLPIQVDGDDVGTGTEMTFRSVPQALRVIAAPPRG